MANPFVDATATYTRTITDERDGTKYEVTYRPLTSGDRALLQDLARMSTSGEHVDSAEMRLGAAQILTLEKAIVAWNLPLSPTRQTIEALHPDLFDAIFENIAWGSVPEEPPADEDPTPPSSEPASEPAEPDDDEIS